jgi:uncharacterized protein YjbI with pentapeptide repeats
MRVVKPQPVLANFSPTQWGDQARMCVAIGVGFRLSDSRVLTHEASVWEALRATPTAAPMSETGMAKKFAEWLVAGHTQCAFDGDASGVLRDWTAQVNLHQTSKKISAQAKTFQTSDGRVLASLSVDHTQSVQGSHLGLTLANPVGHAGVIAPLQLLTWHGSQSSALAGMTPIDARWPERRQWMPKFASTLAGMADDGSHMGWPKNTDARYFQQAAPDQWHKDQIWPCGASYALRGFGPGARGYVGELPKLLPQVLIQSHDALQSVAMLQQTVWFLPDHDLGVMWWTGAVNLKHPLDDSLTMMAVAVHQPEQALSADELMAYAKRRTDVKAPDLAAQSDVPLLPALSHGWAWEQILNADQHPRERGVQLSYQELRDQIESEEARMAQAHHDMQQRVQACSPRLVVAVSDVEPPSATDWTRTFAQATHKHIQDQTFTHQNFEACNWVGWTFSRVRFESCSFNEWRCTDCVFEDVNFVDVSLDDMHFQDVTWTHGSLERCHVTHARWQNVAMTNTRLTDSAFDVFDVAGGKWCHVIFNNTQLHATTWVSLCTDSVAAIQSDWTGLVVRECTHNKLSTIETDISHSQWVKSRLNKVVFAERSHLNASRWQDCECTNTGWIGLVAQGVRLAHCTFENLNAQGADLKHSIWSSCNLSAAQLLNADLREASFDKTSLRDALLSGAQLQGSQVTHCNLIRVNTSNALHSSPELWRHNLDSGAVMYPQRHL